MEILRYRKIDIFKKEKVEGDDMTDMTGADYSLKNSPEYRSWFFNPQIVMEEAIRKSYQLSKVNEVNTNRADGLEMDKQVLKEIEEMNQVYKKRKELINDGIREAVKKLGIDPKTAGRDDITPIMVSALEYVKNVTQAEKTTDGQADSEVLFKIAEALGARDAREEVRKTREMKELQKNRPIQ
jgi:hypothetical protein